MLDAASLVLSKSPSAEADRYTAKGKSLETSYSTGPKISSCGKGRSSASMLTT